CFSPVFVRCPSGLGRRLFLWRQPGPDSPAVALVRFHLAIARGRCGSVQIQKLVRGYQDLAETLPGGEMGVGFAELLLQISNVSEGEVDLTRLGPPRQGHQERALDPLRVG